ncbi:MAG: DUF3048 domain-containing protein, partial [Acidimicrobiales bacterium]
SDDDDDSAAPAADDQTSVTTAQRPPSDYDDDTTPVGDELPAPPTSRGLPAPVEVEPLPESPGALGVLSGEPPYTGNLAQLDPDRFVVQPVALPPAELPEGVAPLTGLESDDPELADRPALLVKLDNTSKGRPQESLTLADLVYEEQIEGGFTRLAAVFHSHVPGLGPVRSGRTTDIALLGSLNQPIFAWSGANRVLGALLRRQDIVDLGAQTRSEYRRAPDRPGTYDLMTDAAELVAIATDLGEGGVPSPHFEYRSDDVGLPESAEPASSVTVEFPAVTAVWDWDGSVWVRTQDGTAHVDASGEQIAAANVIVAFVEHVKTGSTDLAGSRVYEEQFIGQGNALVFTDGHVIEAVWTKPSILSIPTYTTADGVPIAMVPGQTWVELAPPDSAGYS